MLLNPTQYDVSCIELFAGCGGLALGLKNSGINSSLLVEIDKHAAQTLNKNFLNCKIINNDVKNVDYSGLRADIVAGGFPCQAFSHAGLKMGFDDVRGSLFFELLRCVREVKPKIVLGENVRGLLSHDNGRTIAIMVQLLEDEGYRVHYEIVRAQYCDVPQKRERVIIFGIRNDLDCDFYFPKEQKYIIPLKQALHNVPHSDGQKYSASKKRIMDMIPQGGYWRNLPIAEQKTYMGASFQSGGGKTGIARRLSWDEPSLTLTCSPSQKQTERCHPDETRPLTVREYARIQTFPDSWEFCGGIGSQYKQIGNAVPVNLGFYIGKCILAMLGLETDLNYVRKIG